MLLLAGGKYPNEEEPLNLNNRQNLDCSILHPARTLFYQHNLESLSANLELMVNIIVFYLASADTGNESMENVTCCPRYVKDINIRKVSQLLKSFGSRAFSMQ